MDKEQLKKGNELIKIIESTEKGLEEIYKIEESIRTRKDNELDDGLYSLNIGVHSDYSGSSAKFSRYLGNAELLIIIKETLEKQLKEYNEMFSSL